MFKVKGAPSWVSESLNKKRTTVRLRGNKKTWVSQPVIDRVRVNLTDDVSGVNVNRGMFAQFNVNGTKGRDKVIFGDQAGTITKRFNSVINFKKDNVRDTFVFKNTTKENGPFNHAQRIVIKNFGKEDKIVLKNIRKTFNFGDVRNDGSLPGVNLGSIRVNTIDY